jgi:hypothetical protein
MLSPVDCLVTENDMIHQPSVRTEVAATITDNEGSFAFGDVPSGTFAVRAYTSAAVDASLEGITGLSDDQNNPLTLVLPDGHWLVGRVKLSRTGASCRGLVASAVMRDCGKPVCVPVRATVSESGEFRLGPFPAGELQVSLKLGELVCAPTLPEYLPPYHELGEVVLPVDSDVSAVFELGERSPASLSVVATLSGMPASALPIRLYAPIEAGGRFLTESTTDESGRAVLGPVFGGDVDVVVLGDRRDQSWFHVRRGVRVLAGETAVLSINVELVSQDVSFSRGDGSSLSNAAILVYRPTPIGWKAVAMKTDAAGQLRLQQPAGKLAFWPTDETVLSQGYERAEFLNPERYDGVPASPPVDAPVLELAASRGSPIQVVLEK